MTTEHYRRIYKKNCCMILTEKCSLIEKMHELLSSGLTEDFCLVVMPYHPWQSATEPKLLSQIIYFEVL